MKQVLILFVSFFLWSNGHSSTCDERVTQALQKQEPFERKLDDFFGTHQDFFIAQRKRWVEVTTDAEIHNTNYKRFFKILVLLTEMVMDMKTRNTSYKIFLKTLVILAEIARDMEARNTYEILDNDRKRLSIAFEEKGFWSFLFRHSLKNHRPLEVIVLNRNNEEVFRVKRPFHWFFSSTQVSSGGRELGTIQQEFSLIRRKYTICSPGGAVMGIISGPLWRPWTFPISDLEGQRIGQISKRWGGHLQEVFDADTFSIRFPGNWRASEKALILASALCH